MLVFRFKNCFGQPLPRSTPLFMASYSGYAEVVNVLLALPLDRKLDVNRVATERYGSLSGATPLWIASYLGNVEVVKALLKDPREAIQ